MSGRAKTIADAQWFVGQTLDLSGRLYELTPAMKEWGRQRDLNIEVHQPGYAYPCIIWGDTSKHLTVIVDGHGKVEHVG